MGFLKGTRNKERRTKSKKIGKRSRKKVSLLESYLTG